MPGAAVIVRDADSSLSSKKSSQAPLKIAEIMYQAIVHFLGLEYNALQGGETWNLWM